MITIDTLKKLLVKEGYDISEVSEEQWELSEWEWDEDCDYCLENYIQDHSSTIAGEWSYKLDVKKKGDNK